MLRRDFLKASSSAFFAAMWPRLFAAAKAAGGAENVPYGDVDAYTEDIDAAPWWKGNVHMHTLLSDGLVFPVEAAALYKRLGYNFVVLTDHDVTPPFGETYLGESNRYYAKRLTPEYFRRFKDNFPEHFPAVRLNRNGRNEYRIMPFEELAAAVGEKNRYLVIPGNELTYVAKDGNSVHCNLINLASPCRSQKGCPDAAAALANALEKAEKAGCVNSPKSLFMVNHPLWTSYDIDPAHLIAHPEIRFFEVNNSGSMARYNLPPGDVFTHDKWWDAINATRATLGQPLLYGTGSDDQHDYTEHYSGRIPRPGYVRVAAGTLTTDSIMTAMHKGNFYATSGLELSRVRFNRRTNTLHVSVKPEKGFKYRIIFIGSKLGCELGERGRVKWRIRKPSPGDLAYGFNPDRSVPYYSPAIGATLKISDSTDSSYTMQDDDLYVRAKIITDRGVLPENRIQINPVAWTQPVRNRRIHPAS